MSVAAVVATYNRKELLRICLQALMNQTRAPEETIVVDGPSTDGTDLMVKSEFPHITYLRLDENIGGSGNFHEGMKLAYEKGYDWIWVMDDDAMPAKNSLEKLMDALPILGSSAEKICLCSQIITDNSTASEEVAVCPVKKATFVGFAINRNLVDLVGLPRRDFFIYYDDVEYCLRILRAGGEIFSVLGSVIYHKDWLSQPMVGRMILITTVKTPKIPNWKFYYLSRNAILKSHSINEKIIGVLSSSKLCLKIIITQPRATNLVLLGIYHGLLGISGKIIDPMKNKGSD